MQDATRKRLNEFSINDYYLKKNIPTNFHNNFIDLNQEAIRMKRERAFSQAQGCLSKIKASMRE